MPALPSCHSYTLGKLWFTFEFNRLLLQLLHLQIRECCILAKVNRYEPQQQIAGADTGFNTEWVAFNGHYDSCLLTMSLFQMRVLCAQRPVHDPAVLEGQEEASWPAGLFSPAADRGKQYSAANCGTVDAEKGFRIFGVGDASESEGIASKRGKVGKL